MKNNLKPTEGDANRAACPLASLVLLAATHHPQDAVQLLEPFGIGEPEIEKFTRENAELKETILQSVMAGALLDRKTFASLIRVRVGVKLIETEDPRKLATLVTAAAKLPAWVFGEEEPASSKNKGNSLLAGMFQDTGAVKPKTNGLGMQTPLSNTAVSGKPAPAENSNRAAKRFTRASGR